MGTWGKGHTKSQGRREGSSSIHIQSSGQLSKPPTRCQSVPPPSPPRDRLHRPIIKNIRDLFGLTRTQPTGTPIYVDVGELYFEAGSKWSHFHIDELPRYDMKDCPVPLLLRSEGLRKAIASAGGAMRSETEHYRVGYFLFFSSRSLWLPLATKKCRRNGKSYNLY